MNDIHIRWIIRRDMPEVLAIDRACFAYPWVEDDFLRCLRDRNCIGLVAEHGPFRDGFGALAGFAFYEVSELKIEILRMGASPLLGGVGAAMVAKIKSKLSNHRRRSLVLCVRESDLDTHLFFRRQGFQAVAVERGFYEDSGEDAYRFAYHLPAVATCGE